MARLAFHRHVVYSSPSDMYSNSSNTVDGKTNNFQSPFRIVLKQPNTVAHAHSNQALKKGR